MAGFEGADHVNGSGTPLAMAEMTQHILHADADYAALRDFGISTVRESIGWRVVERDGHFDFSSLHSRLLAAQRNGIHIAWTLCHYGWPADVDVFDDRWIVRFARFCHHAATFLAQAPAAVPGRSAVYTPINEISFLAWAVCETGLIHPHRGDRAHDGYALKKRLVTAAMAGSDAIWAVDPDARMLSVDPMVHVVAPLGSPELSAIAARQRSHQFQAWDMLAGHSEPQLGGQAKYLDLVGINYYHDNQWECQTLQRLHWHLQDPRRRPFAALLDEAALRYGRPVVVAETSHVGVGRGAWIREIAAEVTRAVRQGVPVSGLCLYPVVDRPDWENLDHWHHSGLWDVDAVETVLQRRLSQAYAFDLRVAQHAMAIAHTRDASHPSSCPTPPPRSFPVPSLVVFSHLRWDFVYQRPQHLLTRFAAGRPVVFVEEPVYDPGPEFMEITSPCANVTVLRPHTQVQAPGFHDDQIPVIRALLTAALPLVSQGDYDVWFYTPLAVPLLQGLAPRCVVYDCMDELSAFSHAPQMLREREATLMAAADVVFTGGPSLYEAKAGQHPSVHCFPSAVDTAHFARGRDAANAHPQLAGLPQPRLGFFGVIDERFDAQLLATLAAARPDWQICMVGPVVKIDAATLPRSANIHYYGQQPYAELPRFLAGWDVCLMPFALNQATRFISPTKTLEYMAAARPIVSTEVIDVASLYGDVVAIAGSPAEFIVACDRALAETPAEAERRRERMHDRVASLSWDATFSRMAQLIDEVAARETPAAAPRTAPSAAPASVAVSANASVHA
jgi:UDP-galactopyranose mutase